MYKPQRLEVSQFIYMRGQPHLPHSIGLPAAASSGALMRVRNVGWRCSALSRIHRAHSCSIHASSTQSTTQQATYIITEPTLTV
jgi:hypothetical protein